jgi:alpha 1,2-mannosyltransferase
MVRLSSFGYPHSSLRTAPDMQTAGGHSLDNHKFRLKHKMAGRKISIFIFWLLVIFLALSPPKWSPSGSPITPHYKSPEQSQRPYSPKESGRVNAAIVMLARNSELNDCLHSLRQWENRFNAKFGYPYIFLNDQPFTDAFKDAISRLLPYRHVQFGQVPAEHWGYHPLVNISIADEYRFQMEKQGVIYGGSVSYRHMCRFFSGFLHQHPLVKNYDFVMRLEPDVDFYCDLDYDIFKFIQDNNKSYGFNMIPKEIPETIPSLFPLVLHYAKYRRVNSTLARFFMDPQTYDYNNYHFWTNFEVTKLSFMRSPEYQEYFNYIDSWHGFHLERWGDAPVKSLAIGLFLNYSDVHFFNDIGYRHSSMARCPKDKSKCDCPWSATFDDSPHSGLDAWLHYKPSPLFPNSY